MAGKRGIAAVVGGGGRPARKVRTYDPNETVCVNARSVCSEFVCSICLGLLDDTHTIMECLHRFCSECIATSLRLGRKECPTCRQKCASRRSLREDAVFERLLGVVVPNREEYEEQQSVLMEEINASAKPGVQEAREDRARELEERARQERKAQEEREARKAREQREAAEAAEAAMPGIPRGEEVQFVLRVHPGESQVKRLSKEFLRTSRKITMGHLAEFLARKLCCQQLQFNLHVCVLMPHLNEFVVLPHTDTVEKVRDAYWSGGKQDHVLYYSVKRK